MSSSQSKITSPNKREKNPVTQPKRKRGGEQGKDLDFALSEKDLIYKKIEEKEDKKMKNFTREMKLIKKSKRKF